MIKRETYFCKKQWLWWNLPRSYCRLCKRTLRNLLDTHKECQAKRILNQRLSCIDDLRGGVFHYGTIQFSGFDLSLAQLWFQIAPVLPLQHLQIESEIWWKRKLSKKEEMVKMLLLVTLIISIGEKNNFKKSCEGEKTLSANYVQSYWLSLLWSHLPLETSIYVTKKTISSLRILQSNTCTCTEFMMHFSKKMMPTC